MDSFVVFAILLFSVIYFLNFTIYSLSEVETASEMTKIMLERVFYLLTLVNIAFLN